MSARKEWIETFSRRASGAPTLALEAPHGAFFHGQRNTGDTTLDSDWLLAVALQVRPVIDAAWNSAHARFDRLVKAIISRTLGARAQHDVDDVVQSAWKSILTSIRQFDGRCSLSTYIGCIAKRRACDFLRDRQGNLLPVQGGSELLAAASQDDPSSSASRARCSPIASACTKSSAPDRAHSAALARFRRYMLNDPDLSAYLLPHDPAMEPRVRYDGRRRDGRKKLIGVLAAMSAGTDAANAELRELLVAVCESCGWSLNDEIAKLRPS